MGVPLMLNRYRKNTNKENKMRAGFSLIEMSIVLLILSIVVAGGLTVGQNLMAREDYDNTTETLKELSVAIKRFYAQNYRLPCPASREAKLGDAEYGRETTCTDAGNLLGAAPTGTEWIDNGTDDIFIGSLPTRDLKISDRLMKDAFENRITYAVMDNMTDDSTFASASGAITVNDGTGNDILTDAAFVILSHGDDGKGAISFLGFSQAACTGTELDVENCDDDDATFTDTRFNNEDGSASFFDDVIFWYDKGAL
jgi:prepilin-type N-terminal cleavage/methylation domain-containing protein